MTRRHDVHVSARADRRGWKVTQGSRTLSRHRLQSTAVRAPTRTARRDHVELVVQGRDGRIRSKDSYGYEGPTLDRER